MKKKQIHPNKLKTKKTKKLYRDNINRDDGMNE